MPRHGELTTDFKRDGDVYVVTATMWLDPKRVVIPQAAVQDYLRNLLQSSLKQHLGYSPDCIAQPPHPIECEGHACRFCAALDHQPCGVSHPDCPRNQKEQA